MEQTKEMNNRYRNVVRDAYLILGAIKRFNFEIITQKNEKWAYYLRKMSVANRDRVYVSPVAGEDLQPDIIELCGFILDGYVYAFYITPDGIKQLENMEVEPSDLLQRIRRNSKRIEIFKFPVDMFQTYKRKTYYLDSTDTIDLNKVYLVNQNYLVNK